MIIRQEKCQEKADIPYEKCRGTMINSYRLEYYSFYRSIFRIIFFKRNYLLQKKYLLHLQM